MKKFLIAQSMLGLVGIAAPASTSAEAQGFSVRIGDGDRGYGRQHYRGRHRGWDRGRHYGWDRGRHNGWYNGYRRHHRYYGNGGRAVVIQRGYGW